jgi:DNA mismatch repair protein MutL
VAGRIRILPEVLANKIAAGEVVERPAAVVKELVENSLDAGAREITVEIEAGGRRLIRVIDDGTGMSREDALLSLERHATSKLKTDADLGAITTLGFRGEALPSIASVSRVTLATRSGDTVEGTEIYTEGGRIVSVKAHGMAVGTEIQVRNIFFNTPARLKFMRSAETEAGHVGDLLARLAISRPDVRFSYICDGRSQFRLNPGTLVDRVAALLGTEASNGLTPLESAAGEMKLHGLVSRPELTRSTASAIYTFINGRFIRDKVVQHAIMQAYRGVLEKGRYPVLTLFIDLPVSEVDVNVHPTKHEVRFREQGSVHDEIRNAVASVLSKAPWLEIRRQPLRGEPSSAQPRPQEQRIETVREALSRYASTGHPQQPSGFNFPLSASSRISSVHAEEERKHDDEPAATGGGYYSSLSILGQFNAMYILCQSGPDLVLIDQHAAHERIAFQQLREQYASEAVESQGLLFPETIDLSFAEAASLKQNEQELKRLGFDVEPFGGSTFAVKGVPRLVANLDYLRTLRDILVDLGQVSRSSSAEEIADDMLARIACHSVVRGVRHLSLQEMRELLKQMDQSDFAATCPHGRPVLARITLGEIERMFRRTVTTRGN